MWDKHNNILNLWNKAIGVGKTQQHLKPVKSNNSCVQTQHLWNKAIGVGQTQQHLKSVK